MELENSMVAHDERYDYSDDQIRENEIEHPRKTVWDVIVESGYLKELENGTTEKA